MRKLPNKRIDQVRRVHPTLGLSAKGENWGYFEVKLPNMGLLRVIASDGQCGEKWEHVSVSLDNRCPTWEEMCIVKDLFWEESETVLQFHPAEEDYVNFHPFCLHLWRKHGVNAELPPSILIGPRA